MERDRITIVDPIRNLQSAFGPHKKVLVEVRELIRYRLLEDIKHYLAYPEAASYCSTPMLLSQVCRLWRGIIQARSDHWQYFIVVQRKLLQ